MSIDEVPLAGKISFGILITILVTLFYNIG